LSRVAAVNCGNHRGDSPAPAVLGALSDQFGSIGPAMAVVGIGPMLLAFLVAFGFPETARRELEDLNPEDRGIP